MKKPDPRTPVQPEPQHKALTEIFPELILPASQLSHADTRLLQGEAIHLADLALLPRTLIRLK